MLQLRNPIANAKVSARQQCVYEGPWRWKVRQINASGLQLCRCLHSFSCCCLPNLRNSTKFRTYSSSRSSTVIDLGINRKRICNFLL